MGRVLCRRVTEIARQGGDMSETRASGQRSSARVHPVSAAIFEVACGALPEREQRGPVVMVADSRQHDQSGQAVCPAPLSHVLFPCRQAVRYVCRNRLAYMFCMEEEARARERLAISRRSAQVKWWEEHFQGTDSHGLSTDILRTKCGICA